MSSDVPRVDPPIAAAADADLYSDEDYASGSNISSTTSLSSSILHYQYQNGRRYHAYRQGAYVIPNDEREQDRLDLNHHLCTLALSGELYRAPISDNTERVLDIGTGTGLWAIDMADQFPDAKIIGTDLSPIQPSWVPPNCVFEIDDFELEWNFTEPFDFIHARGIEGSVKDFPQLFRQARKNLRPGGWFEVMEPTVGIFSDDDSVSQAPHLSEWKDKLIEASVKFGKEMGVAKDYKKWMVEAGLKNVKEEIYKVPFSPWAKDAKLKEMGRFQQANMLEALDAYSLALFTRFLGWTVEEIQMLLVGVRKELMDRKLHIFSKYYMVCGQREGTP
ncbi:putative methyltransferase [Aspergillus avenaceus]|uniref:Putative methyltransferase n=1 Tax=Aspergillus avenaceus TaxID=36643 RepID=A0A5N6U9D6_ASPAV|nr:putative methyltransferase [Aspergillus avenaceus]